MSIILWTESPRLYIFFLGWVCLCVTEIELIVIYVFIMSEHISFKGILKKCKFLCDMQLYYFKKAINSFLPDCWILLLICCKCYQWFHVYIKKKKGFYFRGDSSYQTCFMTISMMYTFRDCFCSGDVTSFRHQWINLSVRL